MSMKFKKKSKKNKTFIKAAENVKHKKTTAIKTVVKLCIKFCF